MAGTRHAANARRRSALAAVGTVLGLCGAAGMTPLLIAGCGGGGGGSTSSSVNLGRAAVLIGDYQMNESLPGGETEETTFDFIPGASFETLVGSYTRRVLSPRPDGGNDYVSFESGTLAGSILANGHLQVVLTPDADSSQQPRSRPATRQTNATQYEFSVGQNGATLQDIILGAIAQRIQQIVQTYKALDLSGNWTGTPGGAGGFQLNDPRDGTAVGPIAPIQIQYVRNGGVLATAYTAAVTLVDPATGTPYTATGVQAHLYSQYDTKLPDNISGVTKLDAGQFFVVAKGSLPASAGSLTIPNVPILGSVSIPLAGRAFLYEAGGGTYNGSRVQLGTLFLKIDKSDPFYALLPFAGVNPSANGGYIPAGTFAVLNGTSPSPSPSPSPGGTSVGTIQFSNVSGTNATTTTITSTDAAGAFQNGIYNASLTESGTHTIVRVLSIQLGAADNSALTVGKTFPIGTASPLTAGSAHVSYVEEGGSQEFWDAQSGSVTVVANDGTHVTLRVTNAAMAPLSNYGSAQQPTGTFSINATGKF